MEKIKEFLSQVLFTVGDSFAVKMWYAIVAALVLLLLFIIIVVCVVKSGKKKQAKEKANAVKKQQETTKQLAQDEKAEQVEEVVEIKDQQPAVQVVEEQKVEEVATPIEEKQQEEKVVEQEKIVEKKTVATKAPVAKKVVAKPAEVKKPTKRLGGKWKIIHKNDKEYIAELFASNGEIMLSSEIYSTAEGAKNGISTILKGIENGNFLIYRDKGGDYYYKLKSAGNKLLCVGEIYKNKEGCASAVESVKRIAAISPILDEVVKGEEYVEYTPSKANYSATSAKGKWKIEKVENGYSAKLYANNGQLMISTEVVAQKATAEKAVLSVKKNSLEGNFIIDKDKFGRFYYKLRNAQKSVICIGETYDSLDACIKALESVRKFAEISEIVQ